ncbi:MAG: Flp pilus assembly protein CpaB [Methylacidiphilales bacterium]|nr:Flp pilus assembly protein CpaB [Candidatus Methylacidiphilales bacterium]
MKKKSPPYAIIGAAALGIIAIFALVKWKQSQDQAAADALAKAKADMQAQVDAALAKQAPVVQSTPTNMRNVLYATQPVQAGAKISSAFYEKKLTPNDILPDAFTDQSDIVGYYAIRDIEKGDALTPHNINKTLPYMSQRISPGMRALALPVFNAELNNTGGFIVDGDRVDLLFTHFTQDNVFLLDTQLVMQNVNVLYVPGPKIESDQVQGITPAPPPGDPISVTFEVTPEQAQALTYMTHIKNGQFSMILRARNDKSEIKIKPFVGSDYMGDFRPVQTKVVDKSMLRVQELAAKIAAEEKAQGSQGNTNETTNPTPPNP